ncbi:MAG: hypothetical protein IPL78_04680 [Chloroflexi bacterium]|nr:hypothetical protein [Chloroflexota bacterium]
MWKRFCWLLLLLGVGCGRAPATPPADFAVRVEIDGGMLPYSRGVSLRVGEGEDGTFMSGVSLVVQFQPSTTDMEMVYEAVVANRFERIKVDEVEAYDRGGTSVGVKRDGEFVWAYNSGMSFVQERWQDEYEAIYAAAFHIVTPQPDAATFTLTWDERLSWGGWEMVLDMGSDYRGMSDTHADTREVTISTSNAAASYPITLSNSINGNSLTFILDLSQHQQVFLSQEGGVPVMVGGGGD